MGLSRHTSDRPPKELSAETRMGCKAIADMFQGLMDEGLTENQACKILGVMFSSGQEEFPEE